jgi:hypothetical protein
MAKKYLKKQDKGWYKSEENYQSSMKGIAFSFGIATILAIVLLIKKIILS